MVLLTDPTLVAPIYAKLPKDTGYERFHYVRPPASRVQHLGSASHMRAAPPVGGVTPATWVPP